MEELKYVRNKYTSGKNPTGRDSRDSGWHGARATGWLTNNTGAEMTRRGVQFKFKRQRLVQEKARGILVSVCVEISLFLSLKKVKSFLVRKVYIYLNLFNQLL